MPVRIQRFLVGDHRYPNRHLTVIMKGSNGPGRPDRFADGRHDRRFGATSRAQRGSPHPTGDHEPQRPANWHSAHHESHTRATKVHGGRTTSLIGVWLSWNDRACGAQPCPLYDQGRRGLTYPVADHKHRHEPRHCLTRALGPEVSDTAPVAG